MFVSGYDWTKDLEGIVTKIENVLGLENVRAFHLNDSIPAMGSHKDRHANIGEGNIGSEAIKNIINHPKLKDIPFILETPNLKSEELIEKEFTVLKGLVG
jgi:deoxyribonuclease-4